MIPYGAYYNDPALSTLEQVQERDKAIRELRGESALITPTVGRIVWYYPHRTEPIDCNPGEPLAAIVARVHNEASVTLCVFDSGGAPHVKRSVPLFQDEKQEQQYIGVSSFCCWMPYQKGQAAKTEQLQDVVRGLTT
ncbi:MAG TPA: hypothetical protein VGM15_03290 [Burkholderiaceae bacterium]|jgi:hypothetical protein